VILYGDINDRGRTSHLRLRKRGYEAPHFEVSGAKRYLREKGFERVTLCHLAEPCKKERFLREKKSSRDNGSSKLGA